MANLKNEVHICFNNSIYGGNALRQPAFGSVEFRTLLHKQQQGFLFCGMSQAELQERLQALNSLWGQRQAQFDAVQRGERQRVTLDRKLVASQKELAEQIGAQIYYNDLRKRYECEWV